MNSPFLSTQKYYKDSAFLIAFCSSHFLPKDVYWRGNCLKVNVRRANYVLCFSARI